VRPRSVRGAIHPAITIPAVVLTITTIAARRSNACAIHPKIGGLQTKPEYPIVVTAATPFA
jgi:hypothetical protein